MIIKEHPRGRRTSLSVMRPMTREEREAFLAEPHVGILSVTAEPDRAPLTTPIWYEYRPGGLVKVITPAGARKVRLIEEAGRFALCAQVAVTDDYRYVSVEGPVTEIRPASKREGYEMAARYMGPDRATDYVNAAETTAAGNVAIHLRPQRWNTVDFRVVHLG
jgi:nitroimidazol reductase NimA-like FMN-containing flavoprotein (pyridoxamine 5'-phosphate oxidase superfamily)